MLLFGLLTAVGSWLAAHAVAIVLSFVYVPAPRLFAGYALYAGTEIYLLSYSADLTAASSLAIAAVLTAAAAGTAAAVALLRRLPAAGARRQAAAAAVGAAVMLSAVWQLPAADPAAEPVLADSADGYTPADAADGGDSADALDSVLGAGLSAGDPAAAGPYAFRYFTYGSGDDRHRAEYGNGVTLKTVPVDASAYISDWPWLKKLFWGFDRKSLPVNGRVWMPEGSGPRPLVLIVHGNHLMEQFSDDGYGYLGQLLASRGFIAISVDENFLNYSVWSGIPDNDMKARAWMLLKHLQQLKAFGSEPGNPFYGRIDWDKVGLIGHSRGGQAVAMAADARRWFAGEDKLMKDLNGVRIRSVAAMAPTDRAVDGKHAELNDVAYLTLQGARDADVTDFYGDRQYNRTTFTQTGSGMFKASLYMTNANHSRFNTSWGSMDQKLPGGLLLELKPIMDGDDQRRAAQVYISAFLEATLHDNAAYAKLFQDYRYGSDWLPSTTRYYSQYEDGSFAAIADFEEDGDRRTLTAAGTAEATGFNEWSEGEALSRSRNGKGTKGVILEWDGTASYTLRLQRGEMNGQFAKAAEPAVLTFAIADLSRDLPEAGGKNKRAVNPGSSITVEWITADGKRREVPLASVMQWEEPEFVTFTRLPFLEDTIDDGKYKEPNEPVYQTVRVPLGTTKAEDIVQVAFRMDGGAGKAMLDHVGFASE